MTTDISPDCYTKCVISISLLHRGCLWVEPGWFLSSGDALNIHTHLETRLGEFPRKNKRSLQSELFIQRHNFLSPSEVAYSSSPTPRQRGCFTRTFDSVEDNHPLWDDPHLWTCMPCDKLAHKIAECIYLNVLSKKPFMSSKFWAGEDGGYMLSIR